MWMLQIKQFLLILMGRSWLITSEPYADEDKDYHYHQEQQQQARMVFRTHAFFDSQCSAHVDFVLIEVGCKCVVPKPSGLYAGK